MIEFLRRAYEWIYDLFLAGFWLFLENFMMWGREILDEILDEVGVNFEIFMIFCGVEMEVLGRFSAAKNNFQVLIMPLSIHK